MRKYLGSKMSAFAAIMVPFLCIGGPLLFGVSALSSEISGATVFLMVGCIACALVWGLFIKDNRRLLYSWGYFTSDGVRIMTCFSKSTTMAYEKCKGCGIGFYIHGILNSKVGTKIYFIYLSYDVVGEDFRSNMNLWKPTQTQVKVQFNKKLYDYLLVVLPRRQAQMLSSDYKKHFG